MVAITNRSSDKIILTIPREWADQFADEQIVICRKGRGNVVDVVFMGAYSRLQDHCGIRIRMR